VVLTAAPGKNWVFTHWNDDRTDTLPSKAVFVNNSKVFRANYRLIADVLKEKNLLPEAFSLRQNYPNPFNPVTEIHFELPHSEHVRLEIFDLRGRQVKVLVDEELPPGRHRVIWDASDGNGLKVSSGIYFYRLKAGTFVDTKRLVLLK
ncbi:MAG: T9SS type A sorting domain-containing protein, partial [candidate division KSB1 bacterium]|nr:T9SS type A sorting domain-containing protein [candidate division KSB1 bacterium]